MDTSEAQLYPFAAVVGQDELQLALILNAIAPGIGGVLVRGEKGTAKTTTVRGFARLFGGAFVNLPLGATEDRVLGSVDVETVLTTGKAEFKPGLLSKADGGVLYVDEVNLLADHLVDALLDAAASGTVRVERDAVSVSAPARFVLVGTMNPEEGELRPQLLDRFGLAVDVAASREVDTRAEITRRRLAFDDDPSGFCQQWQEQDAEVAAGIRRAQQLLASVKLSTGMLERIAHVCASFDVDGMRADIVIARTAMAHAAWRGATEVSEEDVRVAARLALPHRKRRNPFDEPGIDHDQLDEALDEAKQSQEQREEEQAQDSQPSEQEPPAQPDSPEPSEDEPTSDGKEGSAEKGAPFRP